MVQHSGISPAVYMQYLDAMGNKALEVMKTIGTDNEYRLDKKMSGNTEIRLVTDLQEKNLIKPKDGLFKETLGYLIHLKLKSFFNNLSNEVYVFGETGEDIWEKYGPRIISKYEAYQATQGL